MTEQISSKLLKVDGQMKLVAHPDGTSQYSLKHGRRVCTLCVDGLFHDQQVFETKSVICKMEHYQHSASVELCSVCGTHSGPWFPYDGSFD